MYYCHNCSKNTQIVNNILACLYCGSEAIEVVTQNIPQNNQPPFIGMRVPIFPSRNIMDPTQALFSMMNYSLPRFQLGFSNMIIGPTVTRVFIINGGTEEEKNPVPEQIIQKLQKSQVRDCSVCQENGGNGVKLPCNHTFHENCIKPWLKQKNTCPCCRNKLSI